MPDDPLDEYLATLRAATPPQTSDVDAGDLMDAIRQALDGSRKAVQRDLVRGVRWVDSQTTRARLRVIGASSLARGT